MLILLVDDEPTLRLSLGDALTDAGHTVTLAGDGAEALERIKDRSFDLIISDIRMPRMDGLSLFRRARDLMPSAEFVLMTAYGEVQDAVAALKEGARDYLTKPFDAEELLLRVARVAERHALRTELHEARQALARHSADREIIGRSSVMVRLADLIETIAVSDATALILGESWHRQGAHRPPPACPLAPPPGPLRARTLRRLPRDPHRSRALRP
jgi:two-component system response regulator PilR (NtrC family)